MEVCRGWRDGANTSQFYVLDPINQPAMGRQMTPTGSNFIYLAARLRTISTVEGHFTRVHFQDAQQRFNAHSTL